MQHPTQCYWHQQLRWQRDLAKMNVQHKWLTIFSQWWNCIIINIYKYLCKLHSLKTILNPWKSEHGQMFFMLPFREFLCDLYCAAKTDVCILWYIQSLSFHMESQFSIKESHTQTPTLPMWHQPSITVRQTSTQKRLIKNQATICLYLIVWLS